MEKLLNIGIIQAIVNPNLAWSDTPQMDVYEANVIWRQIQAAFASFQEMSDTKKPDIVVIPELAVATYFESRIKSYAQKIILRYHTLSSTNILTGCSSHSIYHC